MKIASTENTHDIQCECGRAYHLYRILHIVCAYVSVKFSSHAYTRSYVVASRREPKKKKIQDREKSRSEESIIINIFANA